MEKNKQQLDELTYGEIFEHEHIKQILDRIVVPGGYLYITVIVDFGDTCGVSTSMTFVPEPSYMGVIVH